VKFVLPQETSGTDWFARCTKFALNSGNLPVPPFERLIDETNKYSSIELTAQLTHESAAALDILELSIDHGVETLGPESITIAWARSIIKYLEPVRMIDGTCRS
jgi:hypothetical protein